MFKRLLLAVSLLLPGVAAAQTATPTSYPTGNGVSLSAEVIGGIRYPRVMCMSKDGNGALIYCSSSGGGGGGSAPSATNGGTPPTIVSPIAGTDGTNVRSVLTDTSGRLILGAPSASLPVGAGGVYNSSPPTVTSGARGDLQIDSRGNLYTTLRGANGTNAAAITTVPVDGTSGNNALNTVSVNLVYNGATFDRVESATAANATTGTGLVGSGILGKYNTTLPTYTDGQFGNSQMDNRGALFTVIKNAGGLFTAGVAAPADNAALGFGLNVNAQNYLYNGTNNVLARGDTDGAYVKPADNKAVTVTPGAAVNAVLFSVDATGYSGVSIQLTGTFNAVTTFQTSNDNVNWNSATAYSSGTLNSTATTAGANGSFYIPAVGRYVRAIVTSYTSGTVAGSAVLKTNAPINPGAVNVNSLPALSAGASTIGNVAEVYPTTYSSTFGIVTAASSAVSGGQLFKTTPGLIYAINVTSGATAGFALVFNSATIPADGAVTPIRCYPLQPNTAFEMAYSNPIFASVGIAVVFSTTGCFTKTASATAFIAGDVR